MLSGDLEQQNPGNNQGLTYSSSHTQKRWSRQDLDSRVAASPNVPGSTWQARETQL